MTLERSAEDLRGLQPLQLEVGLLRGEHVELGEGLEKKQDDFAAEVAKQAGLS